MGVLNAAEAAIKKKKRVLKNLTYKKKEF